MAAVAAVLTTTAVTASSSSSSWNSISSTSCWHDQDKDSIQSLSPSPPLYYFYPNPDLEICFDARTRTPVYVLERLRSGDRSRGGDSSSTSRKRRPHFVEETLLPEVFRSRNSHYRQSGYDRGHMAPAADFAERMDTTFTLTNACPQHPNLNRKLWNRLEHWVRRVAAVEDDTTNDPITQSSSTERRVGTRTTTTTTTLVLTGPVWLPTSKTKGRDLWEYRYPALGKAPSLVSVPTHFFKLIVRLSEDNSTIVQYAAFCIPNYYHDDDTNDEPDHLAKYLVRWSDLEAVVGMQFFPRLIHGNKQEWLALADQATEAVWSTMDHRQMRLLEDGQAGSTSPTKSTRTARILTHTHAPQHLCRNGVCK
jgi:endonuclease G, mitochondrial